ncbi:MAG: helix-turn-helix domain-containing protein [Ignavibacteriales bacterium]|nr:helix-turn-helix domain-containing protein [Ignavibacteriales bacterium]
MITQFLLRKIKTNKDYQNAVNRYEYLTDNYQDTKELNDYLDVLAMLIDEYENEKFPIADADPIEVLKYLMKEKNIKQTQLAKVFGSQSIVSEVLSKKRGLTLKYIYNMAVMFNVKPQVFV